LGNHPEDDQETIGLVRSSHGRAGHASIGSPAKGMFSVNLGIVILSG
jgi:hypothetical protein